MLRLIYLLRRKPELSREAFQHYWRDQHGPLVASFATTLGIQRYVQVHTIDDPANEAMATARGGMEAPYDGVAELWWDSEEALEHALAGLGEGNRLPGLLFILAVAVGNTALGIWRPHFRRLTHPKILREAPASSS